MPAPLKVHLNEEEDRELLEFQKIDGIPRRVKERAEIIRLNHHGWSVAASRVAEPLAARNTNRSHHTQSEQVFIVGLIKV